MRCGSRNGAQAVSYILCTPRTARRKRLPCLEEAHDLFWRFHRFAAHGVIRKPCRRVIPKVLVHLGYLRGLIYTSDKGSRGCLKTYIHFMDTPPRLACDSAGAQLYIVGGDYRVTPRGIEG
jgi:hypothetical protein